MSELPINIQTRDCVIADLTRQLNEQEAKHKAEVFKLQDMHININNEICDLIAKHKAELDKAVNDVLIDVRQIMRLNTDLDGDDIVFLLKDLKRKEGDV